MPVKTGTLKGSLRATASKTAANARAGTPAKVPWAASVHWGRKMYRGKKRAQKSKHNPFLWNVGYPPKAGETAGTSKDGAAPWIEDLLVKALNKTVKRINRKLARGLADEGFNF